jgi:hypothetical protein
MSAIPGTAKVMAAILLVAPAVALSWLWGEGHFAPYAVAIGLVIGAIFAGIALLSGYVYADSARRGMPPIPWTLLALLVPNGVGFVLYFVLRKPIVHPCPSCGNGIAPDVAFCPYCGVRTLPMETLR